MKKNGILNSNISKALSDLGHTDLIAIGDCGLPIDSEKKIDISLKNGQPNFIDVLETLLEDYVCQGYILASEIKEENKAQEEAIKKLLPNQKSTYISHEDFKKKLKDCKFVIRTGETTPYSNIILESGNIF